MIKVLKLVRYIIYLDMEPFVIAIVWARISKVRAEDGGSR